MKIEKRALRSVALLCLCSLSLYACMFACVDVRTCIYVPIIDNIGQISLCYVLLSEPEINCTRKKAKHDKIYELKREEKILRIILCIIYNLY